MSDALRGNPIALRSCILYDFLLEKSADESYDSLCSVVGIDALPREEFDFWLNRFENGNFALEFYVKNAAKVLLEAALKKLEIRSESKPVEFSDLPTDVLKRIIEKLELKERCILRKVSRGLCSLVDQVRPNFELLEIHPEPDHIWLYIDHNVITYAGPDFKKGPASICKYHVIDEHYRKVCLDDLKVVFKNPKLKLEALIVDSYLKPDDTIQNASNFYGDVGSLLKSFDHQCHVEILHIFVPNQDDVLSILQCFKPRVLYDICLYKYSDGDAPFPLLPIDKLTKTEQWKHAEDVCIDEFKIQEPIESFYHLRQFDVRWDRVIPEMLKGLRDTLLKSTNFKYCVISTDDGIEDVERIMGAEKIDYRTLIYPIPNSTNVLETTLDVDRIVIKKKARD